MSRSDISTRSAACVALVSIAITHAVEAWQIITSSKGEYPRFGVGYIGGLMMLASLGVYAQARRSDRVVEPVPVNRFTKANIIAGVALLSVSALVAVGYLSVKMGPSSESDSGIDFSAHTKAIVNMVLRIPAAWAATHLVSAAASHAVDFFTRREPTDTERGLLSDTDALEAAERGAPVATRP
ncbi:MAG: hypothetical protein P1U40_08035 [Coxiellaceae bacterium]|nr:hypothetical protein [Coxiellaceae bacterium]